MTARPRGADLFPLKDDIPTRRFPVLTVAIIVLCTLAYFASSRAASTSETGNERVLEYGAIPYEITHPGERVRDRSVGSVVCEGQAGVTGTPPDQAPWCVTVFTSMFMHGEPAPPGGQHARSCGSSATTSRTPWAAHASSASICSAGCRRSAAQTLIDPNAAVPTVGASGAIAAVLGGYALLYPHARVMTIIFIIIFFTIVRAARAGRAGPLDPHADWLGAAPRTSRAAAGGGGGVAYFAHIGGFAFGLLAIRVFANHVHEDYERSQRRLPVY